MTLLARFRANHLRELRPSRRRRAYLTALAIVTRTPIRLNPRSHTR